MVIYQAIALDCKSNRSCNNPVLVNMFWRSVFAHYHRMYYYNHAIPPLVSMYVL